MVGGLWLKLCVRELWVRAERSTADALEVRWELSSVLPWRGVVSIFFKEPTRLLP